LRNISISTLAMKFGGIFPSQRWRAPTIPMYTCFDFWDFGKVSIHWYLFCYILHPLPCLDKLLYVEMLLWNFWEIERT
jgi:hypothetical protein